MDTPDSALAARVLHADQLMTQKIELGLRCGQILGPDYDGVPFEDVCRELVQLRAASARGHALIAQWRETAACEREADVYDICASELEAALAAALAPQLDFLTSVNAALHVVQSPWRIDRDATGQAIAVPTPEIFSPLAAALAPSSEKDKPND